MVVNGVQRRREYQHACSHEAELESGRGELVRLEEKNEKSGSHEGVAGGIAALQHQGA